MIDHARARGDELARMFDEQVRRRALPLRIARREMAADIALAECAEDRIDHGMKRHVRIGMTGKAAIMRHPHAAQPQIAPGLEAVHVEPHARSGLLARAQFRLGGFEILGMRDLFEHRISCHGNHAETGRTGHLRIVGRLSAGPAPMRFHNGIEPERLRGLHAKKVGTIDHGTKLGRGARQRIDDRQRGKSALAAFKRSDQPVDNGHREQRTGRIVNENGVRRLRRDRCQAGSHRILPFDAACDESVDPAAREGCLCHPFLPLADHDMHRRDGGMGQEGVDRMRDYRLAAQHRILLGHAAARAFALTGGNDQGGDLHGARLRRICRAGQFRLEQRLCTVRQDAGRRRTDMIRIIDRAEVAEKLTYDLCIPIVREAMIAFSTGETRQLLRSIIPLGGDRMFGIMPGAMAADGPFGAKLISVFPGNFAKGKQSHQGLVVLFDPESGEAVCAAHAGEVTAIRTAAASAVATEALARPDASRLAILGYGEQAATHIRAIARIRPLEQVRVWGRSGERAAAFAARMAAETGLAVEVAATAQEAVREADIVCTVTGASEPVLEGAWVNDGAHVNLVGSSHAGPVEVDNALVVRARFIADSREGVLKQGAEFLKAREAGLIDDDHIAAEIGEVLAGLREGRQSDRQVTAYKSLGHIVQDLASVWALYRRG